MTSSNGGTGLSIRGEQLDFGTGKGTAITLTVAGLLDSSGNDRRGPEGAMMTVVYESDHPIVARCQNIHTALIFEPYTSW